MPSDERASAYEEVLRELQDEFLALMPERVEELRAALTLCPTDLGARTTLQRLGHRIRGTAATVGLGDVGRVGLALERFASTRAEWSPRDVARIEAAIALLDEWTTDALAPGSRRGVSLLDDPRFTNILVDEAPR